MSTSEDKQSPLPSLSNLGSGNPIEEVVEVTLPRKQLRSPTLHHSLAKSKIESLAGVDDLSKLHDTKITILKLTADMGNVVNGKTTQSIKLTQIGRASCRERV